MVKNKDKKSKSDLDETPKSSQEEKELDTSLAEENEVLSELVKSLEEKILRSQAEIENVYLWRPNIYNAEVLDSGGLILRGDDGYGQIEIFIPSTSPGFYDLALSSDSAYAEIAIEGLTYSTIYDGAASPAFLGGGAVTIDAADTEGQSLSGTFFFEAYTDDGASGVNVHEGVFYRLPLTSGTL